MLSADEHRLCGVIVHRWKKGIEKSDRAQRTVWNLRTRYVFVWVSRLKCYQYFGT